jgi:hypothetical protein
MMRPISLSAVRSTYAERRAPGRCQARFDTGDTASAACSSHAGYDKRSGVHARFIELLRLVETLGPFVNLLLHAGMECGLRPHGVQTREYGTRTRGMEC